MAAATVLVSPIPALTCRLNSDNAVEVRFSDLVQFIWVQALLNRMRCNPRSHRCQKSFVLVQAWLLGAHSPWPADHIPHINEAAHAVEAALLDPRITAGGAEKAAATGGTLPQSDKQVGRCGQDRLFVFTVDTDGNLFPNRIQSEDLGEIDPLQIGELPHRIPVNEGFHIAEPFTWIGDEERGHTPLICRHFK